VKSILKLLLVCYLLLALPFQAFASASMRLPAAPVQQPPCHQQMAQASMDVRHHGHEAQAQAQASSMREGHAAHHEKGKCGTCAACCVGAAVASSLPASPALAPPSTMLIPFRAGHLPSVDPVLLERPPTSLLA
jgi:hypothetical protein